MENIVVICVTILVISMLAVVAIHDIMKTPEQICANQRTFPSLYCQNLIEKKTP
jgi:hypothetical protein